jgi:hypothetical protein
MTSRRLYEAGKLVEGKTAHGTWPIRIITEGKGSSGVYSRELLEAHKDVFAGRAMFGNHPENPNEPWKRSPFEMKAQLGPNIEYKVVDGVAGLYGEAIVDDEVDKFLEKFHNIVGVSIFASGDGREDADTGDWIVESFDGTDPYTSVDFVVAPGRGGGVERVAEAFRALEHGTAPADAGNGKEKRIMDEATKLYLEALLKPVIDSMSKFQESLDSAVSLVESVKDAQPERVEAVDTAGELATSVAKESLSEKAVARVLESVKAGQPVADAVAREKALREEFIAEEAERLIEGAGRFGGSGSQADDFGMDGVRFD